MKKKQSATPVRAKPTKYYDVYEVEPVKSPAAPKKTAKPKRLKPAK